MENMENNDLNRLQELGGSDFEIKDGGPDVRGWVVYTGNDERIGEVAELLFSPVEQKVRYLIIDMDSNDLGMDDDRLIIIPIGIAELHPEDDDIIIPNVTSDQISLLPDYVVGQVTTAMEVEIRSIFSGSESDYADPETFYTHAQFDENRFHKPRVTNSDLDRFKKTGTSEAAPGVNAFEESRDLEDGETAEDSVATVNELNENEDRPDLEAYIYNEAEAGEETSDDLGEVDVAEWDTTEEDFIIDDEELVEDDDIPNTEELDNYDQSGGRIRPDLDEPENPGSPQRNF